MELAPGGAGRVANRGIDEWHLHEQMYEIYLPNKNKAEGQGKEDN